MSIEATEQTAGQEPKSLIALLFGVFGFMVAYTATFIFSLPKILFLPIQGVWSFYAPRADLHLTYYGLIANGLLGFLLFYIFGHIVLTWPAAWSSRLRSMLRTVVAATMLAAITYFFVAELITWGIRSVN